MTDISDDISKYYKYTLIENKRALKIDLNMLEITNAEYGSATNKINVLEIIYQSIKFKKNSIVVNNDFFKEDPHYKKIKQLTLTINNDHKIVLDENNVLTYEIEYNEVNNSKIELKLNQLNKLRIDNIIKNKNKNLIANTINNTNNIIVDNTISNNELKKYQNFYKNYINFNPIIGFIILRKVVDNDTDKLWINCYDSIRKYYDNRIMIIDDNSDYKYLTVDKDLVNTSIIYSEFKNRGELLSLYYYHKYNFCDRVIILHDSMYFNKKYDFTDIKNFKFYTRLFSFSNKWYNFDNSEISDQINILNHSELIIDFHHKNKSNLIGCFGCTMIIEYSFLNYIQNTYNIFNLLDKIKNRQDRKGLERTLSCILKKCESDLNFNTITDLFGTIHKHIDLQKTDMEKVFIFKKFIGR